MEASVREKIEEEVGGWSQAEVLDLAGRLIEIAREKGAAPKIADLSRYRGILQTDIDPMEYQRQIRAEWD